MDHALYRFYNGNGALLYIGIALQPFARMGQHRREKSWWGEVATVTIEHYVSRPKAMAAERAAIKAEKPRYNVVHNRDKPPVTCTYTTWWDGEMITLYNVAPLTHSARCWKCGYFEITTQVILETPGIPEVGAQGRVRCPLCGCMADTCLFTDNGAEEYDGRLEWVSN